MLVALDHSYCKDPRFKGIDPDLDPYKLKLKVGEMRKKISTQDRYLKKAEAKEKESVQVERRILQITVKANFYKIFDSHRKILSLR